MIVSRAVVLPAITGYACCYNMKDKVDSISRCQSRHSARKPRKNAISNLHYDLIEHPSKWHLSRHTRERGFVKWRRALIWLHLHRWMNTLDQAGFLRPELPRDRYRHHAMNSMLHPSPSDRCFAPWENKDLIIAAA